MRKIDIKKIKSNALSMFFLFILAMQCPGVIAFLFEKTVEANANTSILLSVFLDINKFFSGNWIALSIFSIALIPLNNLYYSIINVKNDIYSITKNNERNYFEYVLCIFNIFLYGNFFDLDSIKSNYELIKSNVILLLIIIAILILFSLGLRFLAKYIVARRYRGDVINEIVIREEEHRKKKAKKKEIEEKENQSNEKLKEENIDLSISDYELCKDKDEILRHPFIYAYESYKFFYARKKAIKFEGKLARKKIEEDNKIKEAQSGNYYGDSSVAFIGFSVLFFILFVFIMAGDVIKDISSWGGASSIINKIFETLSDIYSNTTNGLEGTETKVLSFLMTFGVIILIFISYIILVYAFTYMFRVWQHLGREAKKTNKGVQKLVEKIEELFSNTVNEVVRLLLFIPDALENIINIFK